MIKDLINAQMDFSKKFRERATITDIIFLTYCMIYPFFLPKTIYFIFLFSGLAITYMNAVINMPTLTLLKTPIATK